MSDATVLKDMKVDLEKPWQYFTSQQLWTSFIQQQEENLKLLDEIDNLKMVCRRLSAAKSILVRDKIAKQCHHLFEGKVRREQPPQAAEGE